MPIRVPDGGKATSKYVMRAGVAGQDYAENAAAAGQRYVEGASKGDANYRAAVVKAASEGRYGAGIRAKGSEKYERKIRAVGAGRFTEGVSAGAPDYATAISKVLSTIAAVTIPERGPKGSPQNFQRIQPIGMALRKAFGKEK
jgi:hypothetical protein